MVECSPARSPTCQEYCPLFLVAKAREIEGLNLSLLANSAIDQSDPDVMRMQEKGNSTRFDGQEIQSFLLEACSGVPQFYPAIDEEFGDLYLCASGRARTVESMEADGNDE